jgi:hypothetical protein
MLKIAFEADSIAFPDPQANAIRAGDHVRTGANAFPKFEVVAVSGDRVWLRDVQFGTDHVVPAARCNRT